MTTTFRIRASIAIGIPLLLSAGTLLAVGQSAAAATPTTYYLNCATGSDSSSGTSPGRPWRTLAKANSVGYRPGDTLALQAGTACTGTLAPTGSGTADQPITVQSYGDGQPARIDGAGATAAILLRNVQGWTVRNLEVTNTGPAPAADQQRLGIYVLLSDYGIGRNYRIQNVSVHDVNGCDCRYPNPTGGIVFEAAGSAVPTGFDGIDVRGNQIRHTDRTGIGTFSSWQRRAVNPNGPGSTFVPISHLSIAQNALSDIGGDGIVVLNGSDARVEQNLINGYNVRTADYNVGAYAYNSDNTLFQYNTVLNGAGVGIAYAIEGANNGTVYQYNYSGGNGGGFLYVCNSEGSISAHNTVRYNISSADVGSMPFLGVFSMPCGPQLDTEIYNNTISAPSAARLVEAYGMSAAFTNNIFYGQPGGSAVDDPAGVYDHNLFSNVTTLPLANIAPVLAADPGFVSPAATAPSPAPAWDFQLAAGSPALHAGVPVPGSGSHDYFGYPIPATGVSIGAYQGPGR